MLSFHRLLTVAFVIALISLTSCANLKKKGQDNGATDSDSVTGTALPDRQEGVSFLGENVERNKFAPVQFEFDSFSVSASESGKIQQVAEFMQSAGNSIIIAGFTDERGTPEYNRGLGERRAQSVRQALINAGADASRLQTVSFGSEMPVNAGSNESAWAANRRAEFGVGR